VDHGLRYNDGETPVQVRACLRIVDRTGGRGGRRIPGGGQASCLPFLVIFFVRKQCDQLLLKNKERCQPVVIVLVSFDPMKRRGGSTGGGDDDGGSFRVLVVVVVIQGVGVEGLVIGGNCVENPSDGTNEIEIDDETPGDSFCMEGCWRV